MKKAKSGRSSDWMSTLVSLLESRLDNVVFRLGFAPSIVAARQLVLHGKVLVDGKRVNISSALVPVGSEVRLVDKAYQGTVYQSSISQPRLMLPDWLVHVQLGEFKAGKLKLRPDGDAIPFPFEERLVAEYYSGV